MTNYKSKYLSLLISLKPELENILFSFDNINVNDLNVNDLKIELYSDIKKYNELISTFKNEITGEELEHNDLYLYNIIFYQLNNNVNNVKLKKRFSDVLEHHLSKSNFFIRLYKAHYLNSIKFVKTESHIQVVFKNHTLNCSRSFTPAKTFLKMIYNNLYIINYACELYSHENKLNNINMKINISNDCDELVIKASNQVYCKLIVNTDDNISINYSYNYNLSREINSYLFDVIESLLKSTPLVKSFNKNKNHFNVLLNDFYNDKSIENNINSNLIADLNNKITHAKNRLEEIDSLILDYKRLICEFEQEGDKIDNYIYNLLGAVESLKIVNI
jgi:hypothetical protein